MVACYPRLGCHECLFVLDSIAKNVGGGQVTFVIDTMICSKWVERRDVRGV